MTTHWWRHATTTLLLTLLPLPLLAQAPGQASTQPTPSAETAAGGFANSIDFGVRVSSITGDPARWQRYRDLRDGPVVNAFRLRFDRNDWLLGITGDHVGYRDQRYQVDAERPGRVSARFIWDQIPMFISQDTKTLYSDQGGGELRIDDAIQSSIQAGTSNLREAASLAFGIETRTRRDNAVGALKLRATPSTDVSLNVVTSNRNGYIPYGATFGFSNAIEVPLPIDSRTTNVGTGVEWANRSAMVRVNWDGSWYQNNTETLVWDNPLRISDAAGGPSQGRMALSPSNRFHTLSTAASVSLPARSRLVGTLALGWARQNEPLLPHTINSALVSPSLPRATAETSGQTASTYLAFTSRPTRRVLITARHRYYEFDTETPAFHRTGTVSYDATARVGDSEAHFYSLSRQTLDLDVTTTLGPAAWKIGYGLQGGDRTTRHWEDTTEHIFRTSVDVVGRGPYSVRALYEQSVRHGDGLDLDPLEEAGEQVTMRHFDIADRDRKRTSIILTAAPHAMFDVIGSLAVGTDDYDFAEETIGLRDNSHRLYSLGINVMPREAVSTGLSYSFEDYDSLINQRQASSLTQQFDPTRRWDLDTDDRVHNVIAYLELPELFPRTDVKANYDYSNARSTFLYSLPAGSTLTTPEQLPPVRHVEHRLELGALRHITPQWALGLDYWFQTYDVEDFALGGDIGQGIAFPILEPGQSGVVNTVLLNYLYRPFTGHTGFLKAVYSF